MSTLLMPRCLRPRGPRRWQNLPARRAAISAAGPSAHRAGKRPDHRGLCWPAGAAGGRRPDAPVRRRTAAHQPAGRGLRGRRPGRGADPAGAERKLHPAAPFFAHGAALGHERYASYHIWAVQPLTIDDLPSCEDLCAQYLSAGLTLRGLPGRWWAPRACSSSRPGGCPTGRSVPPPASGRPGALPRAGTRVRGGGFRLG